MVENKKNAPNHIGIIIDGNRRWAKERNLPTFEGHLRGYEKIREAPSWFFLRGVKILSIFLFSSENWNRSREEVNYLMKLIKKAIDEDIIIAQKKNYQVLISGRIDELPGDLPESCYEIINKTKQNNNGILNVCLNYGGRIEILDAVKKMIKNKVELKQVHEGMIRKYLYHGELGDPDVIVRTSGEQRLSGFQLWQSAYSELLFMQKYWPDFEERDVDLILEEYASRKRRFGGDG
ncbi:MAG: polyprenyl diphosphate synthase [Patescibacteria group bacterium]